MVEVEEVPIVIKDSELVSEKIKKLQKELRAEPAKPSDALDNVIIVDNLPVVGLDKLEKLKNVLKRIYKVCNIDVTDILMPMGEAGSTLG